MRKIGRFVGVFVGKKLTVVSLEAFAFGDQGSLEDHMSLLVLLSLVRGKLVDPAELDAALFACHISNKMAPGQHHLEETRNG